MSLMRIGKPVTRHSGNHSVGLLAASGFVAPASSPGPYNRSWWPGL